MQMNTAIRRESTMALERETFGELFGDLATKSSALVRDEIQLAKQEITEKIEVFRGGAILMVIGAAIGLVAALTLTAAAVIGLSTYAGLLYSSLIIGGALLLVAIVTASIGMGRIKRTNFTPEQTLATLEEDKEWLKELT